jgi:hypothetical protein
MGAVSGKLMASTRKDAGAIVTRPAQGFKGFLNLFPGHD